MKRMLYVASLFSLPLNVFAGICETSKLIDTSVYEKELTSRKVTFVALDLNTKNCWVINHKNLDARYSPFSTFKIPHSIIALESGAVKSVDDVTEWDREQYPAKNYWPNTWRQSHSLRTAFQHSAVWYYQALVPHISPKEYKKWLATFDYGNQVFSSGSNQFWLDGELKISVREQLEFLTCLIEGRCGVKPDVFLNFEKIALQETKNELLLYAKTGAGPQNPNNFDGAFEGWYIGYIKNKNQTPMAAFVIHVEADSFSDLQHFRRDFALRLLTDVGFWDGGVRPE